MAKIALIAQNLDSQVLTTGQGLQGQRHEVMIFTSAGQVLEGNFDFQILTYFKKWSALEAIRLLPHLLRYSPDIFHFFFEGDREKAAPAHWFLLTVAQSLRRPIVSSLGDGKINVRTWKFNPFLKLCQAVIVPTREKLMFLKRKDLLSSRTLSEVILPFTQQKKDFNSASVDFNVLLRDWKPFVFIPAHPDKKTVNLLTEKFQSTGHRLVFLGQRSEKTFSDLRCLVFDQLAEAELRQIIQMSSALLLAFHQFEPSELMRWQKIARDEQKPLVVKSRQLELVPGLCSHGRNGFVLQNTDDDFHRLLQQHPRLELGRYDASFETQSPADHSLNEINRLYVRALSAR